MMNFNPMAINNNNIYSNFYNHTTNIFYIYDTIDDSIYTNIIQHLDSEITKQQNAKDPKITLDICSYGGYANTCFNLLSRIEEAKKHNIIVKTIVRSQVASAGSVLAMAGTKGHRAIGKYASHGIHLGKSWVTAVQNDIELNRVYSERKREFDTVRELYNTYAKIPKLEEKLAGGDYYEVYGQNLIDFGLADVFI
jgi:ATP-dependent protease ClpP protease subunit